MGSLYLEKYLKIEQKNNCLENRSILLNTSLSDENETNIAYMFKQCVECYSLANSNIFIFDSLMSSELQTINKMNV